MSWPSQSEYNEAIQNPQNCFEDSELRAGTVECNNLGLPKARAGNFATVYKLEYSGKKWAVRCFNRQTKDQQERYTAINTYLRQAALPFTVGFSYMLKGIRVGAQWYPIVKMEWADGVPLDTWVKNNLQNTPALLGFLKSFVAMLSTMQQASIAHGDLQHGNILVVNSSPILVDYDGMYVPALSGKTSSEVGQPNYQNPKRTAFDFGPYLDNFSGWVIVVSLFALSVDPKLWTTFKGGDDCLLFRKQDFEAPHRSALFKALDAESNQELTQVVELFKTILACSPQSVPAVDGTFSVPTSVSPTVQTATSGVPEWIQSHRPARKPPSVTPPTGNIGWLIEATTSAGPPVEFANPIGYVRLLVYLSVVLVSLVIELCARGVVPLWGLISVPTLFGVNWLALRGQYRNDPSVQTLNSVGRQRAELRERIRVMDRGLKEVDADRDRINRQTNERKAAIAKEERELQKAEHSLVSGNDAKLQSAISSSLQSKQKLDSEETAELTALHGGLGKTVANLTQSISALGQAEQTELTNALRTIQVAFVQNALKVAWIRNANIPEIGAVNTTRLQAAGILTAADIDYRIQNVKGIGPKRVTELEAWRRSVEANAKMRMPQSLLAHDENSIKLKYASRKTALQLELNLRQEELRIQDGAIRSKYATLRIPLDAVVASERQKHQVEANRISLDFRQKRDRIVAKSKEAEQDAVRELVKCDTRQNDIRKDMFAIQWRIGKVQRELARFSRVSFPSYIKRVMLFV